LRYLEDAEIVRAGELNLMLRLVVAAKGAARPFPISVKKRGNGSWIRRRRAAILRSRTDRGW
jgi:hypothetical protein